MKLIKTCGTALIGALLLTACSGESTTEVAEKESEKVSEGVTEQVPKEETSDNREYNIVTEQKADGMEAIGLQVATDAKEADEFQTIVEELIETYRSKELDSLHIYLYDPAGDTVGEMKALAAVAYTEEGLEHTGTRNVGAYEIDYEEWLGLEDYIQLTTGEEQARILEEAFTAAEEYVQSTEGNGLSTEQLEELAAMVEERTEQLTDETIKEKISQWASLVRENKLEEAGSIVDELEELVE